MRLILDKKAIRRKQRARQYALQALYQWFMSQQDLNEIEAQFFAIHNMEKVDQAYFHQLLHHIPQHCAVIEDLFTPYLDRELNTLNPVELTVLRMGTYELLYCNDLPYRIILDEAISLTKAFGSQDGHRYVNGVLNNVARQIRQIEIAADH